METMKPVEANIRKERIFRGSFLEILTLILAVLLFQVDGIGHAESEISHVFEYDLPVANERAYKRHTATFTHSKHAMDYNITCVRCHHTLEPGATAVDESCRDCHGSEARTSLRNQGVPGEERGQPYLIAIHDMCVDCHKEIKANNPQVKVPLACWRCHIRKKSSIKSKRSVGSPNH
jgi:hypothetical protein